MPKPSMTESQKALAIQLRATGLSYVRIAAKISCIGDRKVSESATYKFLSGLSKPPPAKPEPKQPKPNFSSTKILPEYQLNTYAPIHRRSLLLNRREFTRAEMYTMLEEAVRNTVVR